MKGLALTPSTVQKTLALIGACAVLAAGGYFGYRLTRPRSVDSHASAALATPSQPAQTSERAATGSGSSEAGAAASAAADLGPPVRWLNLAAAALGGRVEHTSSVSEERGWSTNQLIDGGSADEVCTPLCGWSSSSDPTFPQDIVLSFYQQREALIGRVVLDTLTNLTRTSGSAGLPRQVEVSVSNSSATDGFTPVASIELPPEPGERPIGFPPTRARYVRVRIASSHGGNRVLVGEVSVFEAAAAEPSILADFPRNLALPALGGAIVSHTSAYASYRASRLIDGSPAGEWRSADAYLPQEFVFALRDDRLARLDRIVLTTTTNLITAPKVVSVSVSPSSPVEGFEEVGRFTLKQEPRDQSFPIGRQARFVKLRILENFSETGFTSLGEVQLIEGTAPGYESVLFREREPDRPPAVSEGARQADAGGEPPVEKEPNDRAAQASPLELAASISGRIDPIGESDYFKISLPGRERSVLTFELSGLPYIRTSLNLLDRAGATVKRFDPARAADAVTFSWLVDPGEYVLQVTEPPASVVLVWDTSGSMERDVANLQRAVEAYLDQVSPAERVNLIRFSSAGFRLTRPDIEVLLPEFTGDRDHLKKATEGKFDADGGTPFYDAVARAMGLLDGVTGNRVIVAMTDGEDSGSALGHEEFWRLLQAKGIRLYTIGLGDLDRYSLKLASTPRRLLQATAAATNGRFFFTRSGGDLLTFYRQISGEFRTPAAYRLRVTRGAATGTLQVRATGERITAVAAPSQIELILDASGSMNRASGKQRMIDTAKDVLADIVQALPDDVQAALRVYGHRIREGRPGACEDSELVFPFAKLDKPRLLARIRAVQALGTTPIAYSLQQIARDVGQGGGEKMIVLVTDGKEECGGDPAAAVTALVSQGIKVRLNVVGFALADAALRADLRKLAGLTAGQFVEAKDASSLRSALEQSLAVRYEVLDGAGAKIAEGVSGQGTTELPEGVYTVRVRAEKPIEATRVRIAARQTTTVELRKEGREIGIHVGARP